MIIEAFLQLSITGIKNVLTRPLQLGYCSDEAQKLKLPIDDGGENAAGFTQLKTFCELLIDCFVSLKECVRAFV